MIENQVLTMHADATLSAAAWDGLEEMVPK